MPECMSWLPFGVSILVFLQVTKEKTLPTSSVGAWLTCVTSCTWFSVKINVREGRSKGRRKSYENEE